jgi:hypothetical protein
MVTDLIPKARVLIVEDEGIVAIDLKKMLLELGFEVAGVAATAEQALETAERQPLDLVLMDIRIQGEVDGIETARRLRRGHDVPVLYLTAHRDPETLSRAKQTEPFGYLLKPFKKVDLSIALDFAMLRHKLESQLREREHLLTTTLGSIRDGVLTTDRVGQVTFLNPAAELLTGWPNAEGVGHSLDEVLSLRDEAHAGATPVPILRVLDERAGHVLAGAVLVSRTGEQRPVSESAAPVADALHTFGAVVVVRDETEHRALLRQVELNDRLTALGTLAAGIAHEVSNPLTFVMSNLEYLRVSLEAAVKAQAVDAELLETVSEAAEGAQRIAQILTDLRGFTRQPLSGPAECEVWPSLEWALKVTAKERNLKAQLELAIAPMPKVTVDATRLGQVFVNLLTNAAQAIPAGSPETQRIGVTTATDAEGAAVVEISDSGSGISPEQRSRLFSAFFTTKGPRQGTGLGLFIAHGIVESAGGRIEVVSPPRGGTLFRVVLPPVPGAKPIAPLS